MSSGFQVLRNIPWDTDLLYNLKKLEWITHSVSKSIRHGKHASKNLGFNSEFKQFIHFNDGEDARYLDWKVYARTKKKYTRQYHAETTTDVRFFIDNSLSMDYGSRDGIPSKWEASQVLTAILSRLFHLQQDRISIQSNTATNEAHQKSSHSFHEFLISILNSIPVAGVDFLQSINLSLDTLKKNSVLIVVSDFLFELQPLIPLLRKLSSISHNLQFIQILDPMEINLNLPENALLHSLETNSSPFFFKRDSHQKKYQIKFQEHQLMLSKIMNDHLCSFCSVRTDESLQIAISKIIR